MKFENPEKFHNFQFFSTSAEILSVAHSSQFFHVNKNYNKRNIINQNNI